MTDDRQLKEACNSSEFCTTPIKVSVHRRSENPIFGEFVTTVSIDDEAAGPFIVLESNAGQGNGLRVDPEELEAVVVAARQLLCNLPNAKSHRQEDDNEM